MKDSWTWMYPASTPIKSGHFPVSDGHELYFEEFGNPKGKPVLFVHGGPGGGFGKDDHRFFDPSQYWIHMIEQRGAGRSKPTAGLENNTTWKLVEDFEAYRKSRDISKWLVFGGSWGSTLALAYSITHPETVTELILRGIFLIRKKEIDWFYQDGAGYIYPDEWEKYENAIPESERSDYVKAYHKRLTSNDKPTQMAAAKAWTRWEISTSKLFTPEETIKNVVSDEFAFTFARIESHYFVNKGFFERDGWLIEPAQIERIRKIPTVIVQGRYDVVCPAVSAWDLHKAFPEAEFFMVPDAGHSRSEPGISRALVSACDKFSR